MAQSPSPKPSPPEDVVRTQKRSSDATVLHMSKRDKRRVHLLDRAEEMVVTFSSGKDAHYRQQLQALQIDINLILHADVHGSEMIPDLGDQIAGLVDRYLGPKSQQWDQAKNGNTSAIAGKIYSEFANDVLSAIEARDAALTMHQHSYERSLASLNAANNFMQKLAEEEHKALSSTLRDRLINSVTGRKARLNKEKESLEIGESSALLLHPSQFTVANPISPSGIHSKRATRHRKEIEDGQDFPDSNKRKRKLADDPGSPGPTRKHIDNGFSTPIWNPEQSTKSIDGITPLYSIEKLFTEKELTMTYNTAAVAAHQYIVSHKAETNGVRSQGAHSNGSISGDNEAEEVEGADSPPSAPMMERQISHATRSTRGNGNPGSNMFTAIGIEALGDYNQVSNFGKMSTQLPKMPPPLSVVMQKPYNKDAANAPAGLSNEEAASDFARMEHCMTLNNREGMGATLAGESSERQILHYACKEPGEVTAWIAVDKGAMTNGDGRELKAKSRQLLAEDGFGGIAMSKQNSQHSSEVGGIPMSRMGTNDGGSSMGRRRRV